MFFAAAVAAFAIGAAARPATADGGFVEMTMFFSGVDGVPDEPASCYKLREIAVGPFRYQNSLTCFGSERVFGRDGGLIGFDFLRHFDWTFDYSRSRLILAPNGR